MRKEREHANGAVAAMEEKKWSGRLLQSRLSLSLPLEGNDATEVKGRRQGGLSTPLIIQSRREREEFQ